MSSRMSIRLWGGEGRIKRRRPSQGEPVVRSRRRGSEREWRLEQKLDERWAVDTVGDAWDEL